MSVKTQYQSKVTTDETLETAVTAAASPTLTHSAFDTATTLHATTSPTATKCAYVTGALSAGAATVDLTSLTGTNGAAVTFLALKVRVIKLKNTGAADLTIAKGASNGHTGFGSSFSVTVHAGGEVTIYDGGNGVAVSGSDKTLDLSGTGTNAFQLSLVAGA